MHWTHLFIGLFGILTLPVARLCTLPLPHQQKALEMGCIDQKMFYSRYQALALFYKKGHTLRRFQSLFTTCKLDQTSQNRFNDICCCMRGTPNRVLVLQ